VDNHVKIQELNDKARSNFLRCRVMVAQGVQGLDDIAAILDKVRAYNVFTEDNDPHGEHDFGSFQHKGETIF
jgi:Protein of unknown function (DUF3768)